MSRRAVRTIVLIAVVGCGGSAERGQDQVVIRVSATDGISTFEMRANVSGSTAYALDLVYTPLSTYAEMVGRDGLSVTMRRRPSSPYSTDELAAKFAVKGLRSTTVDGAEQFSVTLDSETTARAVAEWGVGGFDLGPFVLEAQDLERGMLRLKARGETKIDVIEIEKIDVGEEWRRLLARDIDVIPNSSVLHQRQLRGVRSIRSIALPVNARAALFFNLRSSALAEPATRRAIAQSIDRASLARVVCGTADCADAEFRQGATPQTKLPAQLRLLTVSFEPWATAAKHLRHQLRRQGTELVIEMLPVANLASRVLGNEHHLVLTTMHADDEFLRLLSLPPNTQMNVAGFDHAEYRHAVEQNELELAKQILRREMPVLPLYEMRQFAAVDSRFCGGEPKSATSWAWLAELYPCEEGAP